MCPIRLSSSSSWPLFVTLFVRGKESSSSSSSDALIVGGPCPPTPVLELLIVGGPRLLLPADRDIDRRCCPTFPLFLDGLLDDCLPFLLLRSLDLDRRFLFRLFLRDLVPDDDDLVPLDLCSVTSDPYSVLGAEVKSLESVSTSFHIGLGGGGGRGRPTNEGSLGCLWRIWAVENAGRFGRSNGWSPPDAGLNDSECTVSTQKLGGKVLLSPAPVGGSCWARKLRGCDLAVLWLAPGKPLLSLFLVDRLLTPSESFFFLLRLLLLLEFVSSEPLVEILACSLVSMPPTSRLPDSSSGST
mmetsp:Transcript_5480/g.13732  ORF Transcript_5480/g.13732 Transcript_5480/m.13732 type:complete len:299 (-) Transcript_5480:450-1346(-)